MDYSKLNIPEGFLQEETICEYTVSEKNKKIMAIELDLAQKLISVCEKYNIRLMVYSGTLLGTIRHKGFVPWDDDMDFVILYEDFLKLEAVAEKEFKHPYFLQTALTDRKYFCGYARLRNSESTGKIYWHNSPKYNSGIYIDIYVMSGLTNSKVKFDLQIFQRNIMEKLLNTYYCDWNRKGIKQIITSVLKNTIIKWVPYETMVEKYRKLISKYNESSDMVAIIPQHSKKTVKRSACPRSDFDNIVSMPYEYITVPVSSNYEECLVKHFGDYMKFPPVEERGTWHNNIVEFDPDTPYKEYIKNMNDNNQEVVK